MSAAVAKNYNEPFDGADVVFCYSCQPQPWLHVRWKLHQRLPTSKWNVYRRRIYERTAHCTCACQWMGQGCGYTGGMLMSGLAACGLAEPASSPAVAPIIGSGIILRAGWWTSLCPRQYIWRCRFVPPNNEKERRVHSQAQQARPPTTIPQRPTLSLEISLIRPPCFCSPRTKTALVRLSRPQPCIGRTLLRRYLFSVAAPEGQGKISTSP